MAQGGSKFIGFQQNAKILRSYGGPQVNQQISLDPNESSAAQIATLG